MELTREEKADKWLAREGFNAQGYTYIYYGTDSYEIKDKLKESGYRFNKILMWHSPVRENTYAEKTFPIHWSTVLAIMAWGEGMYYDNASKLIKEKISNFNPKTESLSKFIEPVNGKIEVQATCTGHRAIETAWGISNIYKFKAGDNEITWFTSSSADIEVGDSGILVGTFKKHEEYDGVKTTYITRARFKES